MAKKKFKYPAALLCTDLLFEMDEYLDGAESWEVVMAVLNKVFNCEEPRFSRKYLYRFYEDLLSVTQGAYDRYQSDGRRKSSPENGHKGGRPPKASDADAHNDKVRELQQEERKRLVYERICEEPYKYCSGGTWEDITDYFDDIVPYPDRLRKALQALQSEGKIKFEDKGNRKYIKLMNVV